MSNLKLNVKKKNDLGKQLSYAHSVRYRDTESARRQAVDSLYILTSKGSKGRTFS